MFTTIFEVLSNALCYVGYIRSNSFQQPLDKEEEARCISLLSERDEEARNKLIEHNLRLVAHIVKKYDIKKEQTEDLISIGTIGLIKAVDSFKPEKGHKLTTYASKCIENEILMYLRKSSSRRQESSIDEPLNTDGEGNELLLGDVLGTDGQVGAQLEQSDERELLLQAVGRLTPREKQIMELRFGLAGHREHTQKEVADQIGISQSYISRLEKRIIRRLRLELEQLV